ncbi:hypothetical protein [Pontibacter sp. G13]|uniref:hypothetical protein n=1 Tax=Pontibacter sp. G13 TaxID=3074898 RepID=UPI00288A7CC7|nr:hypothetical protein [Pontibacter sp. G13]WNJ20863.1 hypothetical protein RJD25_10325 [Pontibacter sp. G13]
MRRSTFAPIFVSSPSLTRALVILGWVIMVCVSIDVILPECTWMPEMETAESGGELDDFKEKSEKEKELEDFFAHKICSEGPKHLDAFLSQLFQMEWLLTMQDPHAPEIPTPPPEKG